MAPGTEAPPKKEVADEAADVLLSLLSFCAAADIDLLEAAQEKLSRLKNKYPVDVSKGSAVKNPLERSL